VTVKISPADPLVPMKLGNNEVESLVDTGTTHSLLTPAKQKAPVREGVAPSFG